jgi:methylmalonyl-CoA/ethylmalonyl-CoA epimerase
MLESRYFEAKGAKLTSKLFWDSFLKWEIVLPMDMFTFHHVGVAVRALPTAIPIYEKLFEYKVVNGPFDDHIQQVSACFLSRGEGDTVLELVAPIGPDSPIHGTLKKGGGAYHVCYQVPDISAAIGFLTEQGSFLLSGPVPAAAFEMREIAWLMTEAYLLVELLQARPEMP